jgi:hypothetical protein
MEESKDRNSRTAGDFHEKSRKRKVTPAFSLKARELVIQ